MVPTFGMGMVIVIVLVMVWAIRILREYERGVVFQLGRFWAVEARVEHGDARGREMGFPTANMHLGHCLAPAYGVYAVRVDILEGDRAVARHDGVANFGIRPMYQVNVPLMETHLFDFDGDLYGKYLSVELIQYVRPEAKFPSLEALIAQIGSDAAKAREILAKTP